MLQHDRTTCTACDPEQCWLTVWYSLGFAPQQHLLYMHTYAFLQDSIALCDACHVILELSRLQAGVSRWCNAALIQDHCNYVTLLLPPNCLDKPRSHLKDGLGWMTSCFCIAAMHQVVVLTWSQPVPDLSTLVQLSADSSSPDAAAMPLSFAPQHGHDLVCQPELDASVLLPAACLCPGCSS